jgi:hypothetical protein
MNEFRMGLLKDRAAQSGPTWTARGRSPRRPRTSAVT